MQLRVTWLSMNGDCKTGGEQETMASNQPFSKRNRFIKPKEISIREDAPETLRYFVLDTARELEFAPSSLRAIICRVLRTRPDPGNWSEYPNVWSEVQELMYGCEWYKVYDIIEAMHTTFARNDENSGMQDAAIFADAIEDFFIEEGIGWRLEDGQIVVRGDEGFESVVKDATDALRESRRSTAAGHLHEALHDLSRRPEPDLAGAIYHAMGALEAVARDMSGESNRTLGDILKRHPDLLPKPLDSALSMVWGYASNEARHVEEGRDPKQGEAELIVGLAATVSSYLVGKSGGVRG